MWMQFHPLFCVRHIAIWFHCHIVFSISLMQFSPFNSAYCLIMSPRYFIHDAIVSYCPRLYSHDLFPYFRQYGSIPALITLSHALSLVHPSSMGQPCDVVLNSLDRPLISVVCHLPHARILPVILCRSTDSIHQWSCVCHVLWCPWYQSELGCRLFSVLSQLECLMPQWP